MQMMKETVFDFSDMIPLRSSTENYFYRPSAYEQIHLHVIPTSYVYNFANFHENQATDQSAHRNRRKKAMLCIKEESAI